MADLRRFWQRQPMITRPLGPHQRVYQGARRRTARAALAWLSVLVSLCLLLGLIVQNRRLEVALRAAKAVNDAATRNEARTRQQLYVSNMSLARRALQDGNYGELTRLLDRYLPGSEQPDQRGIEWQFLRARSTVGESLVDDRPLVCSRADTLFVDLVFVSNQFIATTSNTGITLWNGETGQLVRDLDHPSQTWLKLAMGGDGSKLYACGEQGCAWWDWRDGRAKPHSFFRADDPCREFCVSPDGTRVAVLVATRHPTIHLLAGPSFQVSASLAVARDTFQGMTFSPSGMRIVVDLSSAFIVWELTTGQQRLITRAQESTTTDLAISSNGAFLATCGSDQLIKLWDIESGADVGTFSGHRAAVRSVIFSLDGRSLLTTDQGGTVKIWNVGTREEFFDAFQYSSGLRRMRISPDGRRLAGLSEDNRQVVVLDLLRAATPN